MSIPQSFLSELLSRVDVVDVVGRYVPLKKGGANYMGLCPFHGEKSPSFSVSPTKQFYHCFGCGKNGNAIGFLMDYAGLGFVEAVHDLARQVGLQVPQEDVNPAERERAARQREREQTICGVLERAGEAWRRQLKVSPRAIDYLKGRGLSGEIARRFGLGYAPEGWRGLASVFPDYADPLLVDSGLVIEAAEGEGGEVRRYDRFRDRIMFPIRNVKGECIGFGGRVLGDEKPKYLNSPETPVFSKGRELYGLFEAREAIRQAGHVLVTEGYMDVVALAQLGFAHAVATLGTACTPEHLHKLFRFTDHVVFSFDGDAAGRRAARKALDGALPHATDTRTVRFLFLPEEHDPDSFIRAHGAEAFAAQVAQAQPLSRFLLDCARGDADLGTAEGRAQMTAHARPLWQALPDGALKRQLRSEIAAQVQLPVEELAALWGDPAVRPATGRPTAGGAPLGAGASAAGGAPFVPSGSPVRRWPAASGRERPSSRADHATRLLLLHHGLLHMLSSEEQALLTELPEPHGPLIAWLESQWHDHGALPWAALREALRGHPGEALALRLADGPALADGEATEAARELRGLLDLMLDDHLKQRESAALAAQDIPAYRALLERRQALLRDRLRGRREADAAP